MSELAAATNGPLSASSSSSGGDADDADVPLPLWLDDFRNVSTTREPVTSGSARRRNIHRPFSAGLLNHSVSGRNPAHVAHDIHIQELGDVGGSSGAAGQAQGHQRPHTAQPLSAEARRERMLAFKPPKPKVQERASTARGLGRFVT